MKKAWSYMSIGALGATAIMMYMNNKSSVDKSMKKMKDYQELTVVHLLS